LHAAASASVAFNLGRIATQGSDGAATHDFLREAGWAPPVIATFGGALAYPSYPTSFRTMMRAAAAILRLPTDTRRVHDLTDWPAVTAATLEVIELIRVAEGSSAA
jgi:menaquinone-dependent protoporphyrinogen IX oxidase